MRPRGGSEGKQSNVEPVRSDDHPPPAVAPPAESRSAGAPCSLLPASSPAGRPSIAGLSPGRRPAPCGPYPRPPASRSKALSAARRRPHRAGPMPPSARRPWRGRGPVPAGASRRGRALQVILERRAAARGSTPCRSVAGERECEAEPREQEQNVPDARLHGALLSRGKGARRRWPLSFDCRPRRARIQSPTWGAHGGAPGAGAPGTLASSARAGGSPASCRLLRRPATGGRRGRYATPAR